MTPADPIPPPDRIVTLPRTRLRMRIGAVVVLAVVGIAVAVLVSALGTAGATRTVPTGESIPGAAATPGDDVPTGGDGPAAAPDGSTGAVVLVHLLGAVERPGLYELRDGDRIVDAVAAAGGFTDGADQGAVNLARRLADGEQLYVPVIGEVPAPVPTTGPDAGGGGQQLVDLNTADAAALDTLPGVGPATAQAIIDWREENGGFTTVDDLLSVSGIGEKTFADLEDRVTV